MIVFLLEDTVQVREGNEYPYVNIISLWEQLGNLFIQHKYTHMYIFNNIVYFVLFLEWSIKFLRAYGNTVLNTYCIVDISLRPNQLNIS